jgi:hypothetical protein
MGFLLCAGNRTPDSGPRNRPYSVLSAFNRIQPSPLAAAGARQATSAAVPSNHDHQSERQRVVGLDANQQVLERPADEQRPPSPG